jgi:hypothetical protein
MSMVRELVMHSRKPFGGAIGSEPNPLHSFQPFAGLVAEELAAVTMAWGQAKLLRDALIDAIERYEIANGELKWPALGART